MLLVSITKLNWGIGTRDLCRMRSLSLKILIKEGIAWREPLVAAQPNR